MLDWRRSHNGVRYTPRDVELIQWGTARSGGLIQLDPVGVVALMQWSTTAIVVLIQYYPDPLSSELYR